MRSALRRHHYSFKNAFSGLKWSFTTQPNFRIHLVLAAIAVAGGFFVDLSYVEWSILIVTITLGLIGELVNTAIEAMTDLITIEWRQEAKIAKDVGAGIMLTIAVGSLIIAYLLLLSKMVSAFMF